MLYMYDADFQELAFPAGANVAPGIIGLRLMESPTGSTRVLNAWRSGMDWRSGETTGRAGYGVLSGLRSISPDMPGQQVGFAPTGPGDYRMSVTAGPMRCAPTRAPVSAW
jgi:hypothetical protein